MCNVRMDVVIGRNQFLLGHRRENSAHTPTDAIVDFEGRMCVEYGYGDPAVKKEAFDEHPGDVDANNVY